MAGHQCYHCKQWVDEGEAHDCWTTTEAALTDDLSEDLHEAWERLRECAAELGEQRIYASHNSIMFARKTCYALSGPSAASSSCASSWAGPCGHRTSAGPWRRRRPRSRTSSKSGIATRSRRR